MNSSSCSRSPPAELIEWPTTREFFATMDLMTCPWCGAGPFKSPAAHTQRMHGASADAMREHYGLRRRNQDRAYFFTERQEWCHFGCEDCDHPDQPWERCPRLPNVPKAKDRAEGDAAFQRQAEREDWERHRAAQHRATWSGFLAPLSREAP